MRKKLHSQIQRVTIRSIGWSLNMLAHINPRKAGDIALDLFCSPQNGKAKAHQKSFLEASKHSVIQANDLSVQVYRWSGTGDKVILLHGWDSNSYRWRTLIPYLQKQDLDIYAFDAHAHGLSAGKKLNVPIYTEILRTVLKQLPAEILIGHSMGGMTCIYHQFLYQPDSVRKIISLGAPSELSGIMDTYQSMLGYSSRLMQALEKRIIDRFNMRVAAFSMARFASELKIPGLVIHDVEDNTAHISEGRAIAENWDKAELFETNGLGHRLQGSEVYESIVGAVQ